MKLTHQEQELLNEYYNRQQVKGIPDPEMVRKAEFLLTILRERRRYRQSMIFYFVLWLIAMISLGISITTVLTLLSR